MTANGTLRTSEQVIVYVKELGYDFYSPSLKNPPAVLSLGKQCQEKTDVPTNGMNVSRPC